MTGIILHIGTPKTGTTAIQSAIAENNALLEAADIAFLKAGRYRDAHNDLANAIRRKGEKHGFRAELEQEVAAQLSQRPDGQILLSSEIFALLDAAEVRAAMPFLANNPLKIVIYLRRQDRYAEAFYKQRIKNGRSVMPFAQFLDSGLGRRITDYNALLQGWAAAFPDARIVPRIYERRRFINGDVVADFATLLGLSPDRLEIGEPQRNISPSKTVIDIMLALSPYLDKRQLRGLYHAMKPLQLDGFSTSGDLFTRDTRQVYLDRFAEANELLRQTHFPQDSQLFSSDGPECDAGPAMGLSPEQQALLEAALRVAFQSDADGA